MYLENVTERIGVGGVGWTRQVPKGPRGALGWETTVVQLLVSHGRGVRSGWTLYSVGQAPVASRARSGGP